METTHKLDDFQQNPSYERRVVVFYDVLGWRNHIKAAGNDAVKIGNLRRLILQHIRALPLRTSMQLRVSTFSDNIVISQEIGDKTPLLIQQMALFQIAGALQGFLLRGGITIGEIVHDRESVFGPGLNRAYELESEVARYPRFVLDLEKREEFGDIGDLAVLENGVLFLDPFCLEYISFMQSQPMIDSNIVLEAGLPCPPRSVLDRLRNDQILGAIIQSLKLQIRSPLEDKEWEKIAWLYDRIARQLGVPFARSYPRVRPEE